MSVHADRRIAETLIEFADALDKDRGHSKSYVTLAMREAAAALRSLRDERDTLAEALREARAAIGPWASLAPAARDIDAALSAMSEEPREEPVA